MTDLSPEDDDLNADCKLDADWHRHKLTMLMDYTKFHIGLYAVLITSTLALAAIGRTSGNTGLPAEFRGPMLAVALFFALAGACGGIVAAGIPNAHNFNAYWEGPPRILGCQFGKDQAGGGRKSRFTVSKVAYAEHIFFWLGVVTAFLAVASCGVATP